MTLYSVINFTATWFPKQVRVCTKLLVSWCFYVSLSKNKILFRKCLCQQFFLSKNPKLKIFLVQLHDMWQNIFFCLILATICRIIFLVAFSIKYYVFIVSLPGKFCFWSGLLKIFKTCITPHGVMMIYGKVFEMQRNWLFRLGL